MRPTLRLNRVPAVLAMIVLTIIVLGPLYWVLMSIGAWKGFIQLIHKPFYWEKTVHGLDKGHPNMEKANKISDLF